MQGTTTVSRSVDRGPQRNRPRIFPRVSRPGLGRTVLSFVLLLGASVSVTNYRDAAGGGATAAADVACAQTDPGAFPVEVDINNQTWILWRCPYSVATGGDFESRAQVAIDGEDRILVAANDAASDETVIARFLSDGSVDPSWGASGVARVAHATIPGSSTIHHQLDLAAAGDGSAYFWSGDVIYGLSPSGALLWQTAVARCDDPGSPTLSLSPDETILWTGGYDENSCLKGYVGQIDTASGNPGIEGELDPYVFSIHGLGNSSAWAIDPLQAAVVSIGSQIGNPPGPATVHNINIDASFTYPIALDRDVYRPFPVASYPGGQLLVAGTTIAILTPEQVSVMLMSNSGMQTSFGGDGAVVIETIMQPYGVGANSAGAIFAALSSAVAMEVRSYLPDGNLDTGFDGDGILARSHGIDEMVVHDDSIIMVWKDTGYLFVDIVDAAPPVNSFDDDDGSIFEADIEWLAAADITRGCGTRLFCPTSNVTRGQMAAFLTRALDLPAATGDYFADDESNIFEDSINRLAESGITRGCSATGFCPNSSVTRGQMAAFLVRAMGYTDDNGGDLFEDDDTSIFEADIDRLATAGVTRGCNPPDNTNFCPNGYVTRGQMAAFLHRAMGDT